MVLDGKLSVGLLDVSLISGILKSQYFIEVFVQLCSLVIKDLDELSMALVAVRYPTTVQLETLQLGETLFRGCLTDNIQFVEPSLAPQDVHLALVGRPLAHPRPTIAGGCHKGPILLELDIPPTVPMPFSTLHPIVLLVDFIANALGPLRFLYSSASSTTSTSHIKSAIHKLKVRPSTTAEELLYEGMGGQRFGQPTHCQNLQCHSRTPPGENWPMHAVDSRRRVPVVWHNIP
mmetsp:Transcript_49529/g.115882  ORF Transcript_49529/g.115882 Transcript_49529/m.115882 type:complete len:233 (+) Transcript_49529:892-1590(+)